jgi:hypothetical protein
VRLFARDANGRLLGDYARTYRELERFVECFDGKYNLYVALNPTTSTIGKRHGTSDVTHWSFFPVDIDPDTPDAPVAETSRMVINWMRAEFGINGDPIIIDSGRGRQLWYRLSDYPLTHGDSTPAELDSRPWIPGARARRAMRYWLSRIADAVPSSFTSCKIDPTVSDLPRVMRLPGTINLKTRRRGAVLNPLTTVYDTLGDEMIRKTPEKDLAYEPRGEVLSVSSWQQAIPHLTRACRDYLTEGKSEPGRHTAMWHLVKNLKERGVEQEQSEDAAHYANMLRGAEEALSTTEVEKIITQVYGGD